MQTRREFLRGGTAALVGLGAAAASCNGNGADAEPAPEPEPGPTPGAEPEPPSTTRIRRNVMSLDPQGPEMGALRAGVAAMKQRTQANSGDPTGWRRQAQIHLDSCPHGNWFFLPWHRGYLWAFERICRDASGQADFTLPYWNWTTQRSLPPAFFEAGSPLVHPRNAGPTSALEDEFVGQTDVIDGLLEIEDFETFGSAQSQLPSQGVAYGVLEGTPHNRVHGFTGGDMGTYWSPLDAIFWLHHANVDRLWTHWKFPENTPTDPGWLGTMFDFFHTDGQPLAIQVEDTLGTRSMLGDGYAYDDQPAPRGRAALPAGAPARRAVQFERRAEIPVGGPAYRATLELPAPMRELLDAAAQMRAGRPRVGTVRLAVDGVVPPEGRAAVRVFLNQPDAGPDTPATAPGYAGSLAFFHDPRAPGRHHAGAFSYYLDVGRTVRALRERRALDPGRIEISLVPIRPAGPGPAARSVVAAGVSLTVVEPAGVRQR